MSNFNKVILLGRVTEKPELKKIPSGTSVVEVNLHMKRVFVNNQGEERTVNDWADVTFWGRQAETICQYIGKGEPLFVEGRFKYRQWESQEGKKRSKVDVSAENFQFISTSQSQGSQETPESLIPYFNRAVVMGRLTRDPELRSIGNDRLVTTISLATNRNWTDANGQKQEETDFIDVDFWGKEAEEVSKLYKQGNHLLVEGRLSKQSWDDKTTGEKRSKICVTGEKFCMHEAYSDGAGADEREDPPSSSDPGSGDPGPTEPAPEAPHIDPHRPDFDPVSQEDEEVPF